MFHELDSTLAELLKRELPPSLVEQVSITFATPDGQFPPLSVTLPAIDLFLYELAENRDLRSNEPDVERLTDGRVARVQAPVRIDCHYLVTAWAKAGVQQPEEDEHRMLGEVMRALLRHKVLPREALRGSLKAQRTPVHARVSPAGHKQGGGELWQALGGKPKAAFHYAVTVAMDVGAPEDIGAVSLVSAGGSAS